jgi:hypothetical protein
VNDEMLWHAHTQVVPAALSLLPGKMDAPAARAMLLATALQESGFAHRVQVPAGPAHGFWQFERNGGVADVLDHPSTRGVVRPILAGLAYAPADRPTCYAAIVHNDVLAAVFARLLLWIDPRPMPTALEPQKGWAIYLARWRPGAPRQSAWPAHFDRAWRVVEGAA